MSRDTTTTAATRSPDLGLAPVRGRRRPWLVALGVLLASVGALAVMWLVGAAGQRQEVLAVRHDVAYGQVVAADDLAIVRVSVDPGIGIVPARDRDLLVGQVAATRLAAGTLVAPGMVEPAGEPSAGRVLVPVAVPVERMPAGGLRAGDRLLAIDADADPVPVAGGGSRGPIPATVVRVGPTDVNGVTVVDVTTSAPEGPALAAAAANGRVALVVQPRGR
jgi:hypothetical protein